jgi:hypothetical protein
MGSLQYEGVEDWAAGVVTNQQVDDIPPNASPRARDSALLHVAGQRASVMRRRGLTTINTTPISGSPAIIGQLFYSKVSSGVITRYHLLISDNGRLDLRNSDNTTSAADGSAATPFTSGSYYPDSAVANFLAFICNSQEAKKYNGTNVQKWGIAAPSGAPTLTDSGVGGTPSGTYEGFITYYNSATDHESSPGPTSSTVTVASKKIHFSWSASSDAQVTHARLYIRNTATQPFFYRVTEVAIGTTTYDANFTDASLITKAPISHQYDPPPTGTKLCEWHYSRMFVSDGTDVYFSEEDKPEAFNPTNTLPGINTSEGEEVTALHTSNGVLLITKRSKTYMLIGDSPDNWRVELLDPSIGCVSTRGMLTVDGVSRWWSLKGMVEWTGGDLITPIAQLLIAPTVDPTALDFSQLNLVVAGEDPTNGRIVWALPEISKTRNTLYLPYNYRLRAWDSDGWRAIDAASLCSVEDSTGVPYLYCGGYKGQVSRWWDADNDGAAAGTVSGTVTSATSTTLTCSTATFDTTGGKLIERYVTVYDPGLTTIQRRRVTSNTGTVLTVDSAWTTTPASTWTFIVGNSAFSLDSGWMSGKSNFLRKRYQRLYLLLSTLQSGVEVVVSVFLNYGLTAAFTTTLTVDAMGAVWDSSEWDEAVFGDTVPLYKKARVGKKGRSFRIRIEAYQPNKTLVAYKMGMTYERLTDRTLP